MNRSLKVLIVSYLMILGTSVPLLAQTTSDSLTVYFRKGYSLFERGFQDNGENIDAFIARVKAIQNKTQLNICRVEYVASASPEGRTSNNATLAKKRAARLTSVLHQHLNFPDSLVHMTSIAEDWDGLKRLVMSDPDVPSKDEVLKIIDGETTDRKRLLEELDDQRPWDYMMKNLFPHLRSFRVYVSIGFAHNPLDDLTDFGLMEEDIVVPEEDIYLKDDVIQVPVLSLRDKPEESVVEDTMETDPWSRKLTVKTNLLGWGFLMTNAAVEVDIIENLSFALPIYYSGWDYFTNTLKFRTFMIQPEVRYYLPMLLDGLYVGAHMGLGYWDLALGGDWRYQDADGKSPAIGGGLSVGYVRQFKRNPKWGMEFAIGGGAYDVKYDVFYNEANGPYHKVDQHTTFIGIDNVSVSLTYKFDLRRFGNKKE